jgi:competence protein ComEA
VAMAPEAVVPTMAAALGEVTVHVRGKVIDPGVVTLPSGSRVIDAIEAAGGLQPRGRTGDLNLARILIDGEQVSVGVRIPGAMAGAVEADSRQEPTGLLDLNSATAADLERLPGIGPVLAGRIVAWRSDNGPFPSVDVLGEVSGIGDSLMSQLRPLVRV